MKKIMFNDKYGLTQAVLEGRKTMTRRIATELNYPLIEYISEWGQDDKGRAMLSVRYSTGLYNDVYSHFQPGETVAVAQNYKQAGWNPDTLQQAWIKKPTIFPDLDEYKPLCGWVDLPFKYHKGWTNKMFVLAELMPHRIQITDIKVERLQDISEQECIYEGIRISKGNHNGQRPFGEYTFDGWDDYSFDARTAFAALIDKVSGKGTWESNPWVFAYSFELIK